MTRRIRTLISLLALALAISFGGPLTAAAAPAAQTLGIRTQIAPNPNDDGNPEAAAELAAMQGWIDAVQGDRQAFGPRDSALTQSVGDKVDAYLAGVDTPDFYAAATFTNPENAAVWDFGLGFRYDDSGDRYQIDVQSDGGAVFKSVGSDAGNSIGVFGVDAYTAAPGAENRIDLVVSGTTGYLAINGVYLGTLSLSIPITGGDVFVGSGFNADYQTEGAVVAYTGFQIWSLAGIAAPAVASPQPPAAAAQAPDRAAEQIVRDWYEAVYGDGDATDLSDYLSDDFVMNDAPPADSRDRATFVADTTAGVAALKTAFPDLTYAIGSVIVAGDQVVARVSFEGTQTGALGNIAATGRTVRVMEISIFTVDVENGEITQAWTLTDQFGLLTQLGVPMGAPAQ